MSAQLQMHFGRARRVSVAGRRAVVRRRRPAGELELEAVPGQLLRGVIARLLGESALGLALAHILVSTSALPPMAEGTAMEVCIGGACGTGSEDFLGSDNTCCWRRGRHRAHGAHTRATDTGHALRARNPGMHSLRKLVLAPSACRECVTRKRAPSLCRFRPLSILGPWDAAFQRWCVAAVFDTPRVFLEEAVYHRSRGRIVAVEAGAMPSWSDIGRAALA